MNDQIKYFAYVRKSTEGEERQVLSIESQKDKVKEFFSDLDIVDCFEERHSAFKPYNRPAFEEMIKRIRKGEAHGIISWHPDRLSRNEIDASTITYLVRTGVIYNLKFGSYNFDNSPEGIMMLQLALSQSQYFSSKLGKDVKRGLEKKISLGWLPGVAPEGYLNDTRLEKGQRILITDKKRAPMLRKAFDLMLTGAYSASYVYNKLNEWGYTTRKQPKSGGKRLSRSTWYKILSNPFYAGIITYNGKESQGSHKPIITLDEYNRIQELVGKRGCIKRPKRHDFPLSGLMTCGVCGCSITVERKTKYIKSKNGIREYLYYHCTHKRNNCQQISVSEPELFKQIKKELKKLEMHPLFLNWTLERLDRDKEELKKTNKIIVNNQSDKLVELVAEKKDLISMRAKKLIDNESFSEQLKELDKLINGAKQDKASKENKKSPEELIELTKERFRFCAHALKEFEKGNPKNKKELFVSLGSNRMIIDKKLSISYHNWLLPIRNNVEKFNAELARLESPKSGEDYRKSEVLTSLNLRWLGVTDDVRTKIILSK
ncbi:MAG: recombinase family protein [Patescibacteria group bacterium]|nr:recombinase family protein [Patescibacteria group bacterium]